MLCMKCLAGWAAIGGGGAYIAYRYGGAASWTTSVPDGETMGVTALVVGDAWAAFSAMNPSMFTTKAFGRKGGREEQMTKRDLRSGAAIGTAMALTVAGGASMVTKSWWPVWATVAACAAQWGVLEYSLKHPWGDDAPSIQNQAG